MALEESRYSFEEIKQDNLPKDHIMKSYSSPTILLDDKIIFGAKTGSAGGCSLEIPNSSQIKEKVETESK